MTAFSPPQHETDLLRLPSGDWIEVSQITTIRLSDKAVRSSGEIGTVCHISANGSWHSIVFPTKPIGQAFADALAEYRNALIRRPMPTAISQEDALALIRDIPVATV